MVLLIKQKTAVKRVSRVVGFLQTNDSTESGTVEAASRVKSDKRSIRGMR